MKVRRIIFPALLVGLFLALAAAVSLAEIPQKQGWYLIWHDEFEGDSVDESKWVVEDAALVKNNELQYYSPDEVYVHDGVLTIRSRQREMGNRHYTSGLVETKGKFAQKYGRFEVRAKLPKTRGMWPAHWLLPEDGRWPPEIDIMEMVGHAPNMVFGSLHWGKWPNNKHYTARFRGDDFSEDFHVFAIEWEEDQIRWYVDDKQYSCVNKHIPKEPFYIILNTAVGGNWPKDPDETTVFPQYHHIDYVRVYAKELPGYFYLVAYADEGEVLVKPREDAYKRNSTVKLYARPHIGYKFAGWSGSLKGKDNPVAITMNSHKQIKANFVTDPAAPQVISAGKLVKVSSMEMIEEDVSGANLVDSNLKTRWSSEFKDPQWVIIDLGGIYSISDIRLNWENAYARSYEIEVSLDNTSWQSIYSTDKGAGKIEEIRGLDVKARYVKLTGKRRATEWGYSLWEFEIFGEALGQ